MKSGNWHIFRQSFLEDIHVVALICTCHKKQSGSVWRGGIFRHCLTIQQALNLKQTKPSGVFSCKQSRTQFGHFEIIV